MAHLFLSHSSADDAFVRELREALADLGQEVWIDSRQLKGGDPLESEIKTAIEAASGLAVLVSSASLQSRWVGKELRHGLQVQKQRGRERFAVVPLSLNSTRLGVLEEFFEEEPTYIPVSSGPGGATTAIHDILVALGLRLPTERPPVGQPRPEPVEELVLKLSDLRFHEEDGKRRAAGNAQLIYEPATSSQRAVESGRWRFNAPFGPIEAEELSWYLERWPVWPNPVVADRARWVETNLKGWGQALHTAALPPEHTATVLQAWAGVGENASRRFSVSVDPSLVAGASAAETTASQEAATALLALPWELLRNGDGFLFQGARPTLVRRRLPNTRNLSVPVVATPIRVLLITARPEDDTCGYIDHRESAGPLVAATEELGELMKLILLHPATYASLEAELERARQVGEPYHVVHFDGHGVYDCRVGMGGLCFEDPNDSHKLTGRRQQTVHSDKLGELLTHYRIPLVFLEACQSAQADEGGESVAAELLQRGVASVVAMSHSVLVETSKRFVKAFYGELAKGQRVGQAMLAGQRALHSDPSRGKRYGMGELTLVDWFVPVLYQEQDDPQLFHAIPAPQTTEDLKGRLRTWLGDVPEEPENTGFVGRSRDLLALERLLRQERWAVLRGQWGEGKTALAAELARWLVRSQQVRRAAFVSVELCSHEGAVLDALGRQLVAAGYSAAKFESQEKALLPIERALREQPTLLVIDNMESLLLPPYLEAPELLSEEAALELQAILALAERLMRAGETRILFTSREALPAPFAAARQQLELRQLERGDAVALIERALAAGDGAASAGAAASSIALQAQREEIEALVDAVQCHARTLALLGPELSRRGVAATQAALGELMVKMQQQVAHLPADHQRRREQSLFASVEVSLRRLSVANRERVKVLGVFHGGVSLAVLQQMMDWDREEVARLAQELEATGLATVNAYGQLSLNPALCHYLKANLAAGNLEKLTARWGQEMASYLEYLRHQGGQNAEQAATLTLLELPNLFALLEWTQGAAAPEETIAVSSSIYSLLQNLGKPRLVERLGRVRDAAAAELPASWSHARFEAARTRVEQQLAGRHMREALAGAHQLMMQSRSAGEQAYKDADYDLALACILMAQVHMREMHAKKAIPLLQEGRQRFEAFAKEHPRKGGERMASVCLSELAACKLELRRYDEAVAAYEDAIRCSEQLFDERTAAVNKAQLGTVHLFLERYEEALAACAGARETFTRLKEWSNVAKTWHQTGIVYENTRQPKAAEEAYNRSLEIKEQLRDKAGQADTLLQLGNLYDDVLKRPELAVTFCRRAAELYADPAIGDFAKEGLARSNLADTLRRLSRLVEARHAIKRAIACKAKFGNEAEPWKTFMILSAIEQDDCNPAAAAEARRLGIAVFLSYRREGGENLDSAGRLALEVRKSLGHDATAASSLLQQMAANPGWAEHLPFLRALQAITAGSRDHTLADDPALHYSQAAEVLLLIEALEAGAPR